MDLWPGEVRTPDPLLRRRIQDLLAGFTHSAKWRLLSDHCNSPALRPGRLHSILGRRVIRCKSSLLTQHHVMADGITQHPASENIGRKVGLKRNARESD